MKNEEKKNLVLNSILKGSKDVFNVSKDTNLSLTEINTCLKDLGISLVNKVCDNSNRTHRIKIIVTKNKRHNLPIEWYEQFEDLDKIKPIIKFLFSEESSREPISDQEYKKIVEYFYNNEKYSILYENWKINNESILKPSFDHIIPYSKGGKTELNNLRCCTWIENKMRGTEDYDKWVHTKQFIKENFDLIFG